MLKEQITKVRVLSTNSVQNDSRWGEKFKKKGKVKKKKITNEDKESPLPIKDAVEEMNSIISNHAEKYEDIVNSRENLTRKRYLDSMVAK